MKDNLCECGCGNVTTILKRSANGRKAGEYNRFCHGHKSKDYVGEKHGSWKGGKVFDAHWGYNHIYQRPEDRTCTRSYIRESVLIAQKILGKKLPVGAVVHHVDKNKINNVPSNLVICQDQSYHLILHAREIVLKLSGHAHYRKCSYCKEYDDPINMSCHRPGYRHKKCHAIYENNRRQMSCNGPT